MIARVLLLWLLGASLASANLPRDAGGAPRLNEQLGFGYDLADNLHWRANGALIQTFNVDALNQLSSVGRAGTLTVSGATPAPATNLTVNGVAAQTYADLTFASPNNSLSNDP